MTATAADPSRIGFILITPEPRVAAYALNQGVTRVMVDLEIRGKEERQGHLDTVISAHDVEDVRQVVAAVGSDRVWVRVNPVWHGTKDEVEATLDAGARSLMLPMFRSFEEVARFHAIVSGRAQVVPLFETADSLEVIAPVCALSSVHEAFIGLNDLHRSLGHTFIFEPLTDGSVDRAAEVFRACGIPFGFGGIAKVGGGAVPAESVLTEHVRLGSGSVIISRTFHGRSRSLGEFRAAVDLASELDLLRSRHREMLSWTREQRDDARTDFLQRVDRVVRRPPAARGA